MDLSTTHPTDDADWTAVRYALGELSPADAAAFEAALGEDQAAREALARAATWMAAVGEPARPSVRPVRGVSARRWAAVGTLAAAAVGGVMAFRAEPPNDAANGDAARLAVLWSQAPGAGAEFGEPADEPFAVETPAADPLAPPDWLIAAVEYEAGGFPLDDFPPRDGYPTDGDAPAGLRPAAVERN